jgi:hypothetical protein
MKVFNNSYQSVESAGDCPAKRLRKEQKSFNFKEIFFLLLFLKRKHRETNIKNISMKSKSDNLLERSIFNSKEINKSPLKSVRKKHFKSPTCQ